jgi:Tfp pilus assembly protein PilV
MLTMREQSIKKVMSQELSPNQKGQSLLELVVLIGVIVIVVTGMVATLVYGLKNSSFSQNQLQATKLAQEGLELMRTARQRNCVVNVGAFPYYWSPQLGQTTIWNQSAIFTGSTFFRVNLQATPCNVTSNASAESFSTVGPFNRTITLTDLTQSQLRVTSIVTWTDPSGSHSSNLSTILANIDI